jgi:hypothetical protein
MKKKAETTQIESIHENPFTLDLLKMVGPVVSACQHDDRFSHGNQHLRGINAVSATKPRSQSLRDRSD